MNRLAPKEKWFYINTKNMIADLGTRKGAKITDVGPDSEWMNGYAWMKSRREDFPIKDISQIKLTPEEKKEFDLECLDPGIQCETIYGY